MKNKWTRLISLLIAVMLLLLGGALSAAAAAPRHSRAVAQNSLRQVYVGGMPFGVKFFTEGILVVGFCDVEGEENVNPARMAGLQMKDVIMAINGATVTGAEDLSRAVEDSEGKPLTLCVKRTVKNASKELTLTLTPLFSKAENRYKAGVWVRDSGAGIGTVTYVDPATHSFGGLGHGICDGETGELIPMQRGQVCDVTISGIEKGKAGTPGAIKGYFASGKTGSLIKNTDRGVFGVFTARPETATQLIDVATKEQIQAGKATIRCTLDNGEMGEYAVTIEEIDRNATGSKCFTVTVIDPALIAQTGGIVQGMSGSPIIQNGKLVGAITHVLINDPTKGYGIFIENMMGEEQTTTAKMS